MLSLMLLMLAACGSDRAERASSRWNISGEQCLARLAAMDIRPAVWAAGQKRGCRVEQPVTVTHGRIARFEPPLKTSCAMLLAWLEFEQELDEIASDETGSGIAVIHHYGSYACRNMTGNGRRRSLHAGARALDIWAFTLDDGRKVRVRQDWDEWSDEGDFLEETAEAACDHFNITLTPDHDRFHKDHIHVDIGPWALCGI